MSYHIAETTWDSKPYSEQTTYTDNKCRKQNHKNFKNTPTKQ